MQSFVALTGPAFRLAISRPALDWKMEPKSNGKIFILRFCYASEKNHRFYTQFKDTEASKHIRMNYEWHFYLSDTFIQQSI